MVVLGVVPILGPLLASSLYRRTLINPYSLYMTVYRESFLMVVLFLCRHLFRLLPFIGIIGMPVLCVTEYHLYRRMFLWKAEKYDFRGNEAGDPLPVMPVRRLSGKLWGADLFGTRAAYRLVRFS